MNSRKPQAVYWIKESLFGVWFLGTQTWIRSVLRRALNDLVELIPHKKERYSIILDVGYGHGHSLWMLDGCFKPDTIIGLDVDPRAKCRAKENIIKCNCTVKLMESDAASIDLPEESVDLIFCHQTFHHLINQHDAIKEFFRVLKPGGQLLFSESCRRYIHSFIIKLLFRHPMEVQKTDVEYINMIVGAGFDIEPKSISRPFLWWSLPDLGLLSHYGLRDKEIEGEREETMINLVAYKPMRL